MLGAYCASRAEPVYHTAVAVDLESESGRGIGLVYFDTGAVEVGHVAGRQRVAPTAADGRDQDVEPGNWLPHSFAAVAAMAA